MPARFGHVNLIARDWRALAEFYAEVFGCEAVPPARDQGGEWLARGTGVAGATLSGIHLRLPGHGENGPTLEIYSYGHNLPREGEPAANREGYGHIAFAVDDVDACARAVIDAGGSLVGEIVRREIAGVGLLTFVYARDPEGNLIELQRWS
ncbi:MAG: VOC family protein [Myxococcales bacterium]|nr:VOC family protein [Myxococcales bacterium]MCB9706202.1 VOC family protein [Myxococcales bacterium]